jgi:hypothetical protein
MNKWKTQKKFTKFTSRLVHLPAVPKWSDLMIVIGQIKIAVVIRAIYVPMNTVSLAIMRRKIGNETWEQMKTAYAGGCGLRELARNGGISPGTILSRAKREGWTREIQSVKALAKREDSALTVSPAQAVAMTMQQRGERHVERMAGVSEKVVSHVESLEPGVILNQIDKVEKADRVARRTYGVNDGEGGGPYGVIDITLE